jgi:hypothetical protein
MRVFLSLSREGYAVLLSLSRGGTLMTAFRFPLSAAAFRSLFWRMAEC